MPNGRIHSGARPAVSRMTLAREVYEGLRTYHGTDRKSQTDIRAHGFTLSRKSAGAANADDPSVIPAHLSHAKPKVAEFQQNARNHHYVTRQIGMANNFADLVGRDSGHRKAVLVRVIGTEAELGLQADADAIGGDCLRTERDIPAAHVLRAKNKPNPDGARVFQPHLEARFGKPVSAREAEDWLKRVQTDSEGDSD